MVKMNKQTNQQKKACHEKTWEPNSLWGENSRYKKTLGKKNFLIKTNKDGMSMNAVRESHMLEN